MQKTIKIGVLALAILATVAGSSAFAMSENAGKKVEVAMNKVDKAIAKVESRMEKGQSWIMNSENEARSVILKANGDFHVRGAEVVGVNESAKTITFKLYGLTKELSVAEAKLSMVNGGTATISDFKAGDKVAGWGNYNENTKVVKITDLRNLSSANSQNVSAIQARINELLKMIQELQAKINGSR